MMNELIEKLSNQAIENVSKLRMVDGQEEYSWKPEDYDRAFTKLIVQECINCIKEWRDAIDDDPERERYWKGYQHGCDDSIVEILQHFGLNK